MATPFDIAFLRLAISNALADKVTAERCVALIDERARGGQTVTAAQVSVHLGILDQTTADRLVELTKQAERARASGTSPITQTGASPVVSGTARFSAQPRPSTASLGAAAAVRAALAPSSASARSPLAAPSSSGPPPAVAPPSAEKPVTSAAPAAPPPTTPSGRVPAAPPSRGTGRWSAQGSSDAQTQKPVQLESGRTGRYVPETFLGKPEEIPVEGGGQPETVELEGFQLLTKLGRGPVGAAWDAKRADGKSVVVKIISRKYAKHPLLLERILDDLRRSTVLQDIRIVRALDVIRASNRDVVVFEKDDGRTLEDAIKNGGRLSIEQAGVVASDIAKALAKAEEFGIQHGDVRPAKIFVAPDGRARLADFGLAQAAALASGYGGFGAAFGHPEYLAPEVVQERIQKPTARTDVYALGIVLYQCILGAVPYRGKTTKDTLRAHLEDPLPPPPDDVRIHISKALATLILRMTAKDPRKRIQTAAAALREIEEYLKLKRSGFTSDDEGMNINELLAKKASGDADAISTDDWARESEQAASRSGEWDPKKLDEPPAIGPEEWRPDFSGEGQPLAARVKTDDEIKKEAEAKAAEKPPEPAEDPEKKKSSGYMTALKDAVSEKDIVATKKGEAPPEAEKKPKGNAGARLALRGGEDVARELRRARAGRIGAVVLGVAVLAAVASLLKGPPPPPPPPPIASPPVAGTPDDSSARDMEAKLEALKRGKAALAKLKEDVRGDLDAGRYKAAIERTRSPDASIVALPDGTAEVEKLVDHTLAAARERLARERAEVQERLAKGDLAGAGECARRAQASMPDVLAPHALELVKLVEGRAAGPKDPIPPDATAKIDPTSFKALVSERIRGTITIEAGGVLAVEYRTGDIGLGADVRDVGKRVKVKGAGENEPVRLDPPRERGLLIHELPLIRPIELRLVFEPRTAPGKAPTIGLLAGWVAARQRAAGITWQSGPVELARGGAIVPLGPGGPDSFQAPFLKAKNRHTLALRIDVPDSSGMTKVIPVLDGFVRKGGSVEAEKLRGRVAIVVEDLDLDIVSFRVRGIADLEELQKAPK